MKQLKNIKLKEIIGNQLDGTEMGHLIAGTNDGIMTAEYGCYSDVCTNNSKESQEHCSTDTCERYTCTSGA